MTPPPGSPGEGWSRLRRFGPLALIAIGAAAAFASGLTGHLSLQELGERRILLLAMVRAHPLQSLGAYVAVYALVVALSLPVALVMTLSGGLLFGPWLGGGAAAVGCTAGSAVIFLVCRTAVGDALRGRTGALIGKVQTGVRRNAFAYVAALRLIPVTPFWLANLALGFVDIPLRTFVAATFVGVLPVSVVYAGLGSSLDQLLARKAPIDLHALIHPSLVAPLAGLGLLALTAVAARRWLRRR